MSRLPGEIGKCASDIVDITRALNAAQLRLIMAKEAGDEGWWGTWAEIAFTMSQSTPYLTLPREVARIETINICDRPVDLRNQYYEYLRFGNGRMPKLWNLDCGGTRLQVLSRNNAPGFQDLTNPPQFIIVFPTDPTDLGKRVLVQGRDQNGVDIYSQDRNTRVKGIFVTLAFPFATVLSPLSQTAQPYSYITGYQKDVTNAIVQIMQMDPNSGVQSLLHTMQPGETTGWYRRYFFNKLPFDCCSCAGPVSACQPPLVPGQVQATAIVKLEPIPVQYDPDYLLIQNLEALIEEVAAIRYSSIDLANAKAFKVDHHKYAIGLLQGELAHYLGKNEPAVEFAPFGSARLSHQKIGTMI